jgi:hypothetical protein
MNFFNYKNGQKNMRHQISKTMTFITSLLRKMKSSTLTATLIIASSLAFSSNAFAVLTATVTASGDSVRLTGPWWDWNPEGGPVAVDNGDGTWTVTFDPAPTDSMEYLWVVDGVNEDLTATDLSCAPLNGTGDNGAYANRLWVLDSGDISDIFESCEGSVAQSYDVTFTVEAPAGTSSVRMAAAWWENWDPEQGAVAVNTAGNTWSVSLPGLTEGFEYLWVVDGVTEDLKDNVAASDCDRTGLALGYAEDGVTLSWANRQWQAGGPLSVSDTHDDFTCLGFNATFSVDMTGIDLAGDVPTLQGNWMNWCGLCGNEMSDDDGDNIWTITMSMFPGDYEYKFAIGVWAAQETVPDSCGTGGEFSNRQISIVDGDVTTETTEYGSCPGAGELDTDGDGTPDSTDTDDDNDGVEDAPDIAPLNADFAANDVIAFAEAFGNTVIETGPTYSFPTSALSWGGFANLGDAIYPLTVGENMQISFTASVPSGGDADVRFRFEKNSHPDVDPSYDTAAVQVSGSASATYTIDLVSQGANEFRSFIMYLDTRDVEVAISNVELVSAAPADTQNVSLAGEPKGMIGGQLSITVDYASSTGSDVTGLGLNVHYDSSVLTPASVSDVLQTSIFIAPEVANVSPDSANEDNNASTDMLMNMAWASFTGANWPGNGSANLLTITFDVVDNDALDSTVIGFSDSSTAAGYELSAPAVTVELGSGSWDFDGSGSADALTDGLLLLRYAFGLRGSMLTADATDPSSTLTDSEVQALIETAYSSFGDIDASGSTDALTDGLLLLRYLFGLRGSMLVADATDPSAARANGDDVVAYINSYMP